MLWPREINHPQSAGGCPQCGALCTVFVVEPERPVAFSDYAGQRFFEAHMNDAHKPCPTCCPVAHAGWMSESGVTDERPTALDKAWAEINALGGTFAADDLAAKGFCEAIDKALAILERLGATDAAWRGPA